MMKNAYTHHCSRRFTLIHILIVCFLIAVPCYSSNVERVTSNSQFVIQPSNSVVPIGLVLDANSPLGSMLDLCIQMALSDFYLKNPNFTTVLQLHNRSAQSVLDANLAVEDLLKHEQVKGIIGPQAYTQDVYLSELGQRFNVPIISITARSSYPSTAGLAHNNFSLRATMDDFFQARALAALCQEFQWPEAVLLYEDTEYGYRFQSHLTNSFRDVGIGLVHLTAIPLSADRKHLTKLLTSLKDQETRVFIVHANPSLGFRLFKAARKVEMMSEGSAWIITDGFSNFLSSMDSAARESMEGVVAVRPYVPPSKELRYFQERFERSSSRGSMDLNIHGLWGYDTISALGVAVENIGPATPSSSYGSRLLRELSNARFRGLSGNFELVEGRLKPSEFEIVNLIGTGERRVGFWNPHRGITRVLSLRYRGPTEELKNVVWPGDSMIKPKGWDIPTSGSLRVGVPWKPGFKEFVNAVVDPATNETHASGFAVDIFLYALKQIPFPINYTFLLYNDSTSSNWSYDSMLHEIPEKYDMVVADTTIWAPRASYVDFSLPYSESGIVFVVKNQKPLKFWIFTKPFSLYLWVAILAASLVMGFILWILEALAARAHARALALAPIPVPAPVPVSTQESNIRDKDGRLKVAFLVPLAALAFPETALVGRRTSLFLLACWLFCAFILMQSYTASLSAILTLSHLNFSLSDDHYVGYHNGSFTRDFLIDRLHISPTKLRPYVSAKQYHDAMRRGSKRGGIDAIFDELPYMKLFLHRYENRYGITGPTYRTDGLGFAFGVGSPLVAYFSRAMLNVTQGPEMTALEQKNFGPGYSSQDPLQNVLSQGASGLTLRDFGGLFIILGGLTAFAFVGAMIFEYRNRDRANGPDNNPPAGLDDNNPARATPALAPAPAPAPAPADGERNAPAGPNNNNPDVQDDPAHALATRALAPAPAPAPAPTDGERNGENIGEADAGGGRENAEIEMGGRQQNNEGQERGGDGNSNDHLP